MVCGIDRAGPLAARLTNADDEDQTAWPSQVTVAAETASGQRGLVATPGRTHLHTRGRGPTATTALAMTSDRRHALGRPLDQCVGCSSFDPELTALLHDQLDIITVYVARDRQIFLAHELGRSCSLMQPDNVHAAVFHALQDAMGEAMQTRSIRAWHYTRMTDAEVALTRAEAFTSRCRTLRTRFTDPLKLAS
jgi:hypothetical protein